MIKKSTLLIAALMLSGFTTKQEASPFGQPQSERQAQNALPKSKDPMWKILGKTQIHLDEKKGIYSATYPVEVKTLVGTQVTISGFMLPLEATEKFHHFLLSKRTPTCPSPARRAERDCRCMGGKADRLERGYGQSHRHFRADG